jgi:hypothetical protein
MLGLALAHACTALCPFLEIHLGLAAGSHQACAAPPPTVPRSQADSDGNGFISFQEFLDLADRYPRFEHGSN